ncbi:MAG: hypothetical protein J6L92_01410, partial [Clostridia bacterium]|nr:hypothetical protein [Clostridia bacterium]
SYSKATEDLCNVIQCSLRLCNGKVSALEVKERSVITQFVALCNYLISNILCLLVLSWQRKECWI